MSWVMHPVEVAVFDCNAVALGVSIAELMEAAASALARQAAQMLRALPPEQVQKPVYFLCGPGNNGGDGFAAALLLKEQWTGPIGILTTASRQHSETAQEFRRRCEQSPEIELCDAKWNLSSLVESRAKPAMEAAAEKVTMQQKLREASLIVDCLLGAGFRGTAPRDVAAALIHLCLDLQQQGDLPPVLACDLPSGLGSAVCLPASQSVSFHAAKLPMYQQCDAAKLRPEIGQLTVAALPWPAETPDCGPGEILRFPPLLADARKGDRGRLLIIGGGPYHGAPMLAAQAAARSACDLVHLAVPFTAATRLHWPLHLIVENLPPDASPDFFDEISCAHLLQRCRQQNFDAILLGPGLGREAQTIEAIWPLIQGLIELEVPLVLDADALFILSLKSAGVWPNSSAVVAKPMRGIVTPHRGERQRWLGERSPSSVLELPENSGAGLETNSDCPAEQQVILCSGSIDQLTGRAGRIACSRGGFARLACAGTGDLLAGLCASLLAQGMSPWAAARLGSYLLRQAGQLAADELGLGLVADDLPLYIGRALSESYRAKVALI